MNAIEIASPIDLESHSQLPNDSFSADVIALSILSGAHLTIFTKVMQLLNDAKVNDILVTGGGIIPEEDMEKLYKLGVGKLFAPGSSIAESTNYIQNWVEENK